jgi:hypothetical protein
MYQKQALDKLAAGGEFDAYKLTQPPTVTWVGSPRCDLWR